MTDENLIRDQFNRELDYAYGFIRTLEAKNKQLKRELEIVRASLTRANAAIMDAVHAERERVIRNADAATRYLERRR
jgi:hypothetical protein